MRITHQMMTERTIQSMADNLEKLYALQQKAGGGKKFNKVSENPSMAIEGITIQTTQQSLASYLNGAQSAYSWLEATDFALGQATDLASKAQIMLLQGLNDALGSEERNGIGTGIDGIIMQLVALANTENEGKFIFGGTKTLKTPAMSGPFSLLNANPLFPPGVVNPPDYTITNHIKYNGDTNTMLREISPGETMAINVDGDAAGFSDLITSLVRIRDAMLLGPADPVSGNTILKDPRIGKILSVTPWSTINAVKGTDNPESELAKGTYTFEITGTANPGDRSSVDWEIRSYPDNSLVASGTGDDLTGTEGIVNLQSGGKTIGIKLGFSGDGLADGTSFRFEYNPLGSLVSDIQTKSEALVNTRTTVGAKLQNVDSSIQRMENSNLELKALLSQKQDVDMAEAASMMRNQEMVYQAVMSVAARMNNVMNLFDLLG